MLHDPQLHPAATKQWRDHGKAYRQLIGDGNHSSAVLRELGLKPVMHELIGDCSRKRLLDVGTGGGWIFDLAKPAEAHACDLVAPARLPDHVHFQVQDATDLAAYETGYFDVITSSLVLCYVDRLEDALSEAARVTRVDGIMVAALVHPYFYRTGTVHDDGSFTITSDLSEDGAFPIEIGHSVGPFRYFYRPYTSYLNAFVDAGWSIAAVRDWFFDQDEYEKSGARGDGIKRSHKVPTFSFFKCVRR